MEVTSHQSKPHCITCYTRVWQERPCAGHLTRSPKRDAHGRSFMRFLNQPLKGDHMYSAPKWHCSKVALQSQVATHSLRTQSFLPESSSYCPVLDHLQCSKHRGESAGLFYITQITSTSASVRRQSRDTRTTACILHPPSSS